MPWSVVCSHDLHLHWINWTLLCDTMEVSMLCLAWLTIAQYVFQPALTGRLDLISRKIVSCERDQRLLRWADFTKEVFREWSPRSYRNFAKNIALMGILSAKFVLMGWQKIWGPTCDICDISESTLYNNGLLKPPFLSEVNRPTNDVIGLKWLTLKAVFLYPRSRKLEGGGYTGIRSSICPSVDTTLLPLSRVQFFSDCGQTC